MRKVSQSIEIGGRVLTLEVGGFASQANAAVLARYGGTMVLATVVSASPREELNYLPLQVEFVERLYAGGRIKGSRWVKREGRPSDEAILTARLIDRSIRPLFPQGYRNEIQVIVTVLSVDAENNADLPAIWATSAALALSDIPWKGPVGALRIGFVPQEGKENFIINPTYQDLNYSDLDLVVATTGEAVIMLEGGAKEVSEEIVLKGIERAQKEASALIDLIKELQKKLGKKKQKFDERRGNSFQKMEIQKEARPLLKKVVETSGGKREAQEWLKEIKEALVEKYEEEALVIEEAVSQLLKELVRQQIVEKRKRPDGRRPTEIRPLEIEVGILPRTHGSAMFKRGETQALTVTTLGSPSLEQLIEKMIGEETKRYIHHYYMPPFSVGETGRLGWPSRREVGHGALAERALEPVIPSEEKFPYTIRVVSEILSSNGSTSMAAVCGSTLSLMDAGVPIKAPVAGIAMGLIKTKKGEEEVILSDITGLEDNCGDMDCKVAGTKNGLTALQLDVKTLDLRLKDLKKAFAQAQEGRLFILKKMLEVLPASRAQISKFAPKIKVLHLPVEKIGEVIGPGGRTIREIINQTGAAIDIEDDGTVNISAPTKEAVERATAWIKGLTREIKIGDVFEGVVKRVQPFGAFVEIIPGKEGLVHISRLSPGYVKDPYAVVKVGQKVKVRVISIDELGRVNLSLIQKGGRVGFKPPKRGYRSRF